MQLSLADVHKIQKPNGKSYFYHRKTKTRIIGEYGTPEFLASYLEASKKEVPVSADGLFSSLLLRYQQSAEYKEKAANTKRQYQLYINALRERFGTVPLKEFEARGIKDEFLQWRDELIAEGRSATARNLLKFSQTLLQWSEERGILDVNRLRGVRQLYRVDRSGQTWDFQAIRKILEIAPARVCRAVLFGLWSGQRQGDLIKAKWTDIQNDALIVEQGKTGAIVGLPIVGGFQSFLNELPRDSEHILNSSLGGPWEASSLRQAWRTALGTAELKQANKTFHDLRGTTATTLADMGATEAQIAAVTGHAIGGQAPTLKAYLRKTHVQARTAMELLSGSWIGHLQNVS